MADDPHPTYVYGVRRSSAEPVASAGIGGAALHHVETNGLAALVSELPSDEELQLGREELTAHARVLEQALEEGTVLPMRFGVVMESDDAVRSRILEAHHDELADQLQQFDGKVELRVRAMYDEQQLMREIVREDETISRLREHIRVTPDDASYFDRIRLGELIVAAIDGKRHMDADEILDQLEPLAEATRIGVATHERMVMSASFLVDRKRIGKFDKAVDDVGRQQADRMRIKYTGPLPPHSFAELESTTASEA